MAHNTIIMMIAHNVRSRAGREKKCMKAHSIHQQQWAVEDDESSRTRSRIDHEDERERE
jgi:hypothetical protein